MNRAWQRTPKYGAVVPQVGWNQGPTFVLVVEGPEDSPNDPKLVLTRQEVRALLGQLEGAEWIMASLLYGSGLRVLEMLRLRVKDVDFGYGQITVRDGKGGKDRITMLPQGLVEALRRHLARRKLEHEGEVKAGTAGVYLPEALRRKYPTAATSWIWQYVFAAARPRAIRVQGRSADIILTK